MKWNRTHKSKPRFDLQPYTVTAKNGTMINASRSNHSTTRNIYFFKHWQQHPGNDLPEDISLRRENYEYDLLDPSEYSSRPRVEDVPTFEDNQILREPNPEEARKLVITQFQDKQVFGELIEQVSNQPKENLIHVQTKPTRRQSNRQRKQIVRFEAGPASG